MADGEILQRFTPPAIRVIQYAKEEARRFRGNTVGTEHVLLGLICEQEGVAALVLEQLGVSLGRAQNEIRRQMDTAPRSPGQTSRSWSAGARRSLELALDEARELNPKLGLPNFVDTEHLLLGLLRDQDSTALRVLRALGVEPENVRAQVIARLGGEGLAPGSRGVRGEPFAAAPAASRLTRLLDLTTHFGYDPRTGRVTSPEENKRAGQRWQVEGACAYSLNALLFDTVEGNREAKELSLRDRYFRPVAVLTPFRSRPGHAAAMAKEQGFAYVRLFPELHGYALSGFAARDLLAACAEVQLPVMVSMQGVAPTEVVAALDGLQCTLILTGVRYHTLGEVLALARRVPNLYVDIGGVATPDGIALLAEAFRVSQLVFGSDYPSLQVGCTVLLLQNSGLSEEAQAWIGGANARQLLEAGR